MTEVAQGTTITLIAQFYEYAGGPAQNIASAQITITDLSDSSVVVGPTSTGVSNPATGVYTYNWAVSPSQDTGSYLITWSGTSDGNAVEASEIVLVTSYSTTTGYNPGPCLTWDPTWLCDISVVNPAVTGTALLAATEVLNARTAYRFDSCQLVLRPCRKECFDVIGYDWWEWGSWPRPYIWNGTWYNASCGSCSHGGCSCVALQEVQLPAPVREIIEVKVNGIPLTSSDYRLDDRRTLVRLDGELWPYCNNLALADTETGTWSVTASFGEALPELGKIAVAELALEFAKMLDPDCDSVCRLPPHVQSISRQGVDIQLIDPNSIFKDGRLGLYFTDLFLDTFNPNDLRMRSRVYNLDAPNTRLVGQ